MKSICGLDCCDKCALKAEACSGCRETNGHPCGGSCMAADIITNKGFEAFTQLKHQIISEFNSLGIKDLSISDLNLLNGAYVNLEYTLPNGQKVKLLEDTKVYLGNQLECKSNKRCYGVVADEDYLLVCEYGSNGENPEIIVYRKR